MSGINQNTHLNNLAIQKIENLIRDSKKEWTGLKLQCIYLQHTNNSKEIIDYLTYLFEQISDYYFTDRISKLTDEAIKDLTKISELKLKKRMCRTEIKMLNSRLYQKKNFTDDKKVNLNNQLATLKTKIRKLKKNIDKLETKHTKTKKLLHPLPRYSYKLNQYYVIYWTLICFLKDETNPEAYRILKRYLTIDSNTPTEDGNWLEQWCRLLEKIKNPNARTYTGTILNQYDDEFIQNNTAKQEEATKLREIYIKKMKNYEKIQNIMTNKNYLDIRHLSHIPIPKLKESLLILLERSLTALNYGKSKANNGWSEDYNFVETHENIIYVTNIHYLLNLLANTLPNEILHYIISVSINENSSYTNFISVGAKERNDKLKETSKVWENIRRLLIEYAQKKNINPEQADSLYQQYNKNRVEFEKAIQSAYQIKNNKLLDKFKSSRISTVDNSLNILIKNIVQFGVSKSDFRLCLIVLLETYIHNGIIYKKDKKEETTYNARALFYKKLQHSLYTTQLSDQHLLFNIKDLLSNKGFKASSFKFLSDLYNLLNSSVRESIPYEQTEMPAFQNLRNQYKIPKATDDIVKIRKIDRGYGSLLNIPIAGSLDFAIKKFTEFNSRDVKKLKRYLEILYVLKTLKQGGCTDEMFQRILIEASGNNLLEHCENFFALRPTKKNDLTLLQRYSIVKLHAFLTSKKLNEFLKENNSQMIRTATVKAILPQQVLASKTIATVQQQQRLQQEILLPLAKKLKECLNQQQEEEFEKWAKKLKKIYLYYQSNYIPQKNDCFAQINQSSNISQIILAGLKPLLWNNKTHLGITPTKILEILPQQSSKIIATQAQQDRLHQEIFLPLSKKLEKYLDREKKEKFDELSTKFISIYKYYQNNYISQENDCFTQIGKLPEILGTILEEQDKIKSVQAQKRHSDENSENILPKKPRKSDNINEKSNNINEKSDNINPNSTIVNKKSLTNI